MSCRALRRCVAIRACLPVAMTVFLVNAALIYSNRSLVDKAVAAAEDELIAILNNHQLATSMTIAARRGDGSGHRNDRHHRGKDRLRVAVARALAGVKAQAEKDRMEAIAAAVTKAVASAEDDFIAILNNHQLTSDEASRDTTDRQHQGKDRLRAAVSRALADTKEQAARERADRVTLRSTGRLQKAVVATPCSPKRPSPPRWQCRQENVICRFNVTHGVFWVPEFVIPGVLAPVRSSSKPHTYSITIRNLGRCRSNCYTHLWARLVGAPGSDVEGILVGTSSSSYSEEAGKQVVVVLEFVTTRPGDYLLEVEQRFWHGGAASVDSGDFEFAARSMDLESHRYKIKDGTTTDWPSVRDEWVSSGCLQIRDSPFAVRLEPSSPSPTPTPSEHGDASAPSQVPACRLPDLARPGFWAPQTPTEHHRYGEVMRNVPVGPFEAAPMMFHTPGCTWSLSPPQLERCLARVSDFVLVGDSLIRMKANALMEYAGIDPEMIEHLYKSAGGQLTTKMEAKYRERFASHMHGERGNSSKGGEGGAAADKIRVVITDDSVVHQAWRKTWTQLMAQNQTTTLQTMVSRAGEKVVWIFYEPHYVNDFRTSGITEPRTQEFGREVAQRYQAAGFVVHRTSYQTLPLKEVNFTNDGLHYAKGPDTFLAFMLLSSACHEVISLYGNKTAPKENNSNIPALRHFNMACWDMCLERSGPCRYCGRQGVCCRSNFPGDHALCAGKGGNGGHVCILPPKLQENKTRGGADADQAPSLHGVRTST